MTHAGRRDLEYSWRGVFESHELNALHAEGFGYPLADDDWRGQVDRHSLGWVCARHAGDLVGWVNVAWDGGAHAFILDTVVATALRRHGIGSRLVHVAIAQARAAGCEWLHVDFDDELTAFYVEACGFRRTPAGLIALR